MSSIPTKARFKMAEEAADRFLAELGVSRLPFDPLWALQQLGCRIYTYEEVGKKTCTSIRDIICASETEDGFSAYDAKKNKYIVIYNDKRAPSERIRWTLAHELGHIVLGHFIEFEETRLSRGGLTDSEYKILDQEADAFASEVLAPEIILYRMLRPNFYAVDIQNICGLSMQAAEYKNLHLMRITGFRFTVGKLKILGLFRQYILDVRYGAINAAVVCGEQREMAAARNGVIEAI